MAHVTIPDGLAEVIYPSFTGTGPLNFTFPYLRKADIKVRVGATLLPDNQWSVVPAATLDGGFEGGAITLVSPVTAQKISITRETEPGRVDDFAAGGARPTQINTALDLIHAVLRDHKTLAVQRGVRLGPGDNSGPINIPDPTARANTIIAFGGDGGYEPVSRVNVDIVAGIASNIQALSDVGVVNAIVDLSDVDVIAALLALDGIVDEIAAIGPVVGAISLLGAAPYPGYLATVAGAAGNIATVAGSIASVNTAATNIAAILAAPTQATNAATSATASATSATNSANSATASASSASAAAADRALTQAYADADVDVPVEGEGILTFNPNTAVNLSSNVITINAHGVREDEQVTYRHGGGTAMGGLTHDTEYWAVSVTTNTLALSATRGGDPVDITSVGAGTAHQLLPVRSAKHHAAYARLDAFDSYAAALVSLAAQGALTNLSLGDYANATAAVTAHPDATAFRSLYFNTADQLYHVLTSLMPAESIPLTVVLASQAEAETGTNNSRGMTPLRTQQSIHSRATLYRATRAALKAIPSAQRYADMHVHVTGATAFQDGWEGVFVWRTGDRSADVTADGTANVIAPDDASTGSSGAWYRVQTDFGRVFDVTHFGAVADGQQTSATANTNAFDAALAAAKAVGGGVIYWPAAPLEYYITNTRADNGDTYSQVACCIDGNNIHVRGAGIGATKIRLKDNGDCTMFRIGTRNRLGVVNSSLSDISLDGNRANQAAVQAETHHFSGVEIAADGAEFCVVRNVSCKQMQYYGGGVEYGSNGSRNCLVENFYSEDSGADGWDWKDNGSNGFGNIINGMWIKRFGLASAVLTSQAGLDLRTGVAASNIVVTDYGSAEGKTGIRFLRGLGNAILQTQSSSLDNFYCQPTTNSNTIGVRVVQASVFVSNGQSRGCGAGFQISQREVRMVNCWAWDCFDGFQITNGGGGGESDGSNGVYVGCGSRGHLDDGVFLSGSGVIGNEFHGCNFSGGAKGITVESTTSQTRFFGGRCTSNTTHNLSNATADNSARFYHLEGVSGPTLVAGNNLSDLTNAGTARTNLGLAIGTNVQAWDTQLDSLAALSYSGNGGKFIRVNAGATAFELATISGGGDALTSGTLAQFAATTSAQLAGVISDETGTGSLVFATSPQLTTPNLGTPSAGTLTNCTSLPVSTGISGLGTGVATFLATPSSANLAAAITNETGSGALVFGTSPTLTTPDINGGTIQSRVQISSETTGTLTSASANKTVACSGGITLPNSVFTAGDNILFDPGTSNRTFTRGSGVAMYVNGTDSASATLAANKMGTAYWRSASVVVLSGGFS